MESAGDTQPRPPPIPPSAACHNATLVMMIIGLNRYAVDAESTCLL